MPIQGIQGMSPQELTFEVNRGGKFVSYEYCCSAIFITIKRGTDVQFIRAGESRAQKSLPWTLVTLVVGWWEIPWGPIATAQTLWKNLRGGDDRTAEVALALGLQGIA